MLWYLSPQSGCSFSTEMVFNKVTVKHFYLDKQNLEDEHTHRSYEVDLGISAGCVVELHFVPERAYLSVT
jgi:hypothetical protein